MEKILLLTHGGWGTSLKKSVEMIIGRIDFVDEVALCPKDVLQDFTERVKAYLTQAQATACEPLHITIMTDLFGGTPTNVAAVLANEERNHLDVITGLNSALLLEACSQIMNTGQLKLDVLLENSQHSIFNVMEKIYRKGE